MMNTAVNQSKSSSARIEEIKPAQVPLGYMRKSQEPLRASYIERPEAAEVVDWACTSTAQFPANNPLRTQVIVDAHNPTDITIGVHKAVGGNSDAPTPGDMPCGALAVCLDSTIRIISNLIGIELMDLSVEVKGYVDVRGTLMIDQNVPVNFQRFDVSVKLETKQPISASDKSALLKAAENSCIVMQTLKHGSNVKVQFQQ